MSAGSRRGVGVLRATIVCVAVFAVVAGAAWTSNGGSRRPASPIAQPDSLFGGLIPLPPGARSVSMVGDSFDVSGIPMRVGHFLVDMEPAEVMAYYVEFFSEEGLDVDGTAMSEDGGGLVAWDHSRGIQRTITVFKQGEGSMVFPALAALESSQVGSGQLPPGPTGARLVSDVVTRDGTRRSRTVSMQTPLSEDLAAADLANRLQLSGHRVDASTLTVAGHVVEATDRNGRRLVYTLSGGPDRMTAVSVVLEGQ